MRISDWSSDVCSSDLPAIVGSHRVAVRRLRHIDVPVVGPEAFLHHLYQLVERAGHQRAACDRAVEEGLFVHLGRPVGMVDEHHPHMFVAARKDKEMGKASGGERECEYVKNTGG